VLNAGIVVFILWGSVARSLLIAWLVLMVTITLLRFALVQLYRRAAPTADQIRLWRTLFILGAGAAGVAWGAAGLLLFLPELMAHQVFLAFVLGGMAAGSVGLLSSVRTAFLAFFIPTVLPIIIRFLVHGGTVPVAMGFLGLFFAGALLAIARNFHASIVESLNLRFENYELIRSLSAAKEQAEAAMHDASQNEQRYRAVVEEQTDLICRFLPDTTLTFVNSAYSRYFGKQSEELLGKSFLSLFPEAEQQAVAAHIASLLQHPQVMVHERATVSKEGERRWQQWVDRAIVADTGRVVEFQSVGRDITERKRAEEAVQRSEEHFRALTENALDIVAIVSSDGAVRYVSPSAERALGYTQRDVIGTNGFGFVHPDDLPGLMATFAEALQKPGVALYQSEYRIRHKDGSWRIFESVGKNLLDNPAVEGIVINARDITTRKQAEEALRQAYRELERRVEERTAELSTANALLRQEIAERQRAEDALLKAKEEAEAANRAKSEFLATMSHELRTPLSVILGYGSLLVEGMLGGLSEEQGQSLRRINNSARELLDLITAVLDVSRLEAGRLPMKIQRVEMPALLEEIKAETEAEREQASLTYTWTLQGDLPLLYTDPGKLKIVLKNLIRNAVKFTEEGSITVEAQGLCGGIEIRVIDTGIGIPAEALELIFEPFHQVGITSPNRRGIGLGLHIVKRLLALLGGTITVESKLGSGSTFRVWVPRERSVPLDVSADVSL
jgi:PAS domain S-box-containing protein